MILLPLLVINSLLLISCNPNVTKYEVLFSWKSLDFKFPTPSIRAEYIRTRRYIPENNVVAGIKVHMNRIFVTVPRLREGVPSTLNYVDTATQQSPLLVPYPSWNMQRVGNCNAFQFVMSMEIDRWGRMWIIDVGRFILSSSSSTNCPAKLIILDIASNKILHKHEFPADVVNPQTNFLNDICVECKTGRWECWAYMTDTRDAKLVIFSLAEDKSWFVKNAESMEAYPQATEYSILGTTYRITGAINGITLSPRTASNHDRLYYSPLSSYSIYSVPTLTLKRLFSTGQTVLPNVTVNAKSRPSQSGGIIMNADGLLFTGQQGLNAVSYFNTTMTGAKENQLFPREVTIIQNDTDLQWPDTFSFDAHGNLYFVTCRMHKYFSGTLDFNDVNFRIIRIFVGSRSYMY